MSFWECGNEYSGFIKCGGGREDLLAFHIGLFSVEFVRRVESLAEISPAEFNIT